MNQKCRLCPHECNVCRPITLEADDAKTHGVCSSPLTPRAARAALHLWEEPVLSNGKGAGAIFFSGCNLHCAFCQNYSISSQNMGFEVNLNRLKEIYHELIAQGAANIDLVTPTHYAETILQSLDEPLPVPVVWNSNGYEKVETLKRFEGKIQIYLPDLKYADDFLAIKYSAAPDYFKYASNAILEMFRQTGPYKINSEGVLESGVIIRHLILPSCVENSLRVIDWVAKNFKPGELMFSLMRQYVPCGRVLEGEFPELNRTVSDYEYSIVEQALFDSGIEDGFVQEEPSASTDFIPSFNGEGIIR